MELQTLESPAPAGDGSIPVLFAPSLTIGPKERRAEPARPTEVVGRARCPHRAAGIAGIYEMALRLLHEGVAMEQMLWGPVCVFGSSADCAYK